MTLVSDTLDFCLLKPAEVWDKINCLDTTKKTSGDLPTLLFKLTSDLSFSVVTKLVNAIVEQCTFQPNKLLLADISPVFQSGNTIVKTKLLNN